MASGISPPSPMEASGQMDEKWKFFKQKFELYLKAIEATKKSSEYRASLLLTTIGDYALRIYNNFKFEEDGHKMNYEEIVKKFEEQFKPEKNVTYERHTFFLRNQRHGESIEAYVTELQHLSSTCQFENLRDSLIKDRLVLGITDITVRERLLQIKDLNLPKTISICRAAEQAKNQLQCLSSETSSMSIEKVNLQERGSSNMATTGSRRHDDKGARYAGSDSASDNNYQRRHPSNSKQSGRTQIRKSQFKSSQGKTFSCRNCATQHGLNQCPAFGHKCRNCGKLNHFARSCMSKINEINFYSDSDSSDSSINSINCINYIMTVNQDKKYDWNVTLNVHNNTSINFKLDTGAQINAIPVKFLNNLKIHKNNLIASNSKITTYTGSQIDILGKCSLLCKYKDFKDYITFYIVNNASSLSWERMTAKD